MQQFVKHENNHTKPAFALAGLFRWNAFHLDLLSSIYVPFVAFIGIFVKEGKIFSLWCINFIWIMILQFRCCIDDM